MDYEQLQKKYNLLTLSALEIDYDIDLKDSKYPIRDILRKMEDRFESWCDRIQNLLHSDSNMESMFECDFITQSQKNQLLDVFKEFMSIRRGIQGLLLENNEKEQAEHIKSSHKTFLKHKKLLKDVIMTISKKWNDKSETKDNMVKYFG